VSIRLIASELDGTLLRSDGALSPRTVAAIGAAQAAGLVVVFVTARPPRVVRDLAHAAGLTGLVVCANGAMIYDVGADALVHHERLDAALAREFSQRLRTRAPGVVFATEHGHQMNREANFPRLFEDVVDEAAIRIDDVEALCEADITKLIVHHPEQDADMLAAWISAEVGARAVVTHSGGPFVEIGVVGVSKASGLARLCADLGIEAAEVAAFGDMPNDVEMLTFAGLGVAMANAHADTLAAADEIAASNDEDGVAQVIERILAAQAAPPT
jgi:Cof subfamily protein (haloacid dehalogenase superfamily)